jgi:eukaryotic-like serine/threonine-protein kinase
MSDDRKPPEHDGTVVWINGRPPDPAPRPSAGEPPPAPAAPPRPVSHLVEIGDTLNNIYRVTRFIGAGGMGAVYEGEALETHERVAIKVILPQLADDPRVLALFRNEAGAMKTFAHPALVQYLGLARDPLHGLLYIATRFIEGPQLSEVLGERAVSAEQLRQLGIRLASGLAVAHELNVIHRDLSPDNVLLPAGRLEQAKIIDFGIAKDVAGTEKTVIGSAFAGKLTYAAPEQVNETGDIGFWTDVYSLGLVLLAVALGRNPPMGTSQISASEARRKVPDLSTVPEELRPCLATMLQPDRRKRYQTMHDVVDALEKSRCKKPFSPLATVIADAGRMLSGFAAKPLHLGLGIAVAAALIFVLTVVLWPHPGSVTPPHPPVVRITPPPGLPREEVVRQAVEGVLPAVACSWLDIDYPQSTGAGIRVTARGVSGDQAWSNSGLAQLQGAAKSAEPSAIVAADAVLPAEPQACRVLDAIRQFREASSQNGRALSVTQPQFHLQANAESCDPEVTRKGLSQAVIVMDIRLDDPNTDFTLLGLDGNGAMQQIVTNRAQFDDIRSKSNMISDRGNGQYRWTFCTDEKTALSSPHGLAGILMIKGHRPFNLGLPLNDSETETVSDQWLQRFAQRARAEGWTTQMAWYQVLKN